MSDQTNVTSNEPAADTGTAPGNNAGELKAEKTFTQAQLDAIIADRLKRQEETILKKYGDVKELASAAKRLKELEDAGKSETQRLTERLTAAEQQAAALKTRADQATIRAEFVARATASGVAGDRMTAALKLLDASKLTIADDGSVAGLDDAVKTLLDEYPFLKTDELTGQGRPTTAAPPKVAPTNPAGSSEQVDLSWFRLANQGGNTFRRGGVNPPPGEE